MCGLNPVFAPPRASRVASTAAWLPIDRYGRTSTMVCILVFQPAVKSPDDVGHPKGQSIAEAALPDAHLARPMRGPRTSGPAGWAARMKLRVLERARTKHSQRYSQPSHPPSQSRPSGFGREVSFLLPIRHPARRAAIRKKSSAHTLCDSVEHGSLSGSYDVETRTLPGLSEVGGFFFFFCEVPGELLARDLLGC